MLRNPEILGHSQIFCKERNKFREVSKEKLIKVIDNHFQPFSETHFYHLPIKDKSAIKCLNHHGIIEQYKYENPEHLI